MTHRLRHYAILRSVYCKIIFICSFFLRNVPKVLLESITKDFPVRRPVQLPTVGLAHVFGVADALALFDLEQSLKQCLV